MRSQRVLLLVKNCDCEQVQHTDGDNGITEQLILPYIVVLFWAHNKGPFSVQLGHI